MRTKAWLELNWRADASRRGRAARAASAAGTIQGADEPYRGGQSFTAITRVLVADGKTTPISTLKPGDEVEASDTRTGKDQAETITAVLVRHDTDLYDLSIKSSHSTAIIRTTTSHLFWDALSALRLDSGK